MHLIRDQVFIVQIIKQKPKVDTQFNAWNLSWDGWQGCSL